MDADLFSTDIPPGHDLMSDPKATILERVRKILMRTEDAGCTQAEAENAFALASRLMTEHNLTQSDVNVSSVETVWTNGNAYVGARITYEMNKIINMIKRFFFVDCFIQRANIDGQTRFIVKFFGKSENVETAIWTFNAFLAAVDRLFASYRRQTGAPQRDRRAFTIGCCKGFTTKLDEERRSIESEHDRANPSHSGETALALVNVATEIERKMYEFRPDLKPRATTFNRVRDSGSAESAGFKAGKSLNLNRGIGGSGRKALD